MRWGVPIYLVVWLVVTGVQVAVGSGIIGEIGLLGEDETRQAELQLAIAKLFGFVVLVQLLKALIAVPRLHDLGQPKDDALMALIPLGNLRLFIECTRKTPKPEVREKRLAAAHQFSGALSLWWQGLKLLLSRPLLLIGGAAFYGVGFALVDEGMNRLFANPPMAEDDGGLLFGQIIVGTGLFCALYAMIQFSKRATASRASWWPALFSVPLILIGFSLTMNAGMDAPMDPTATIPRDELIISGLAGIGAFLLWDFIGGSAVMMFIADAVQRENQDGAVVETPAERVRAGYFDFMAGYGGMILAITVGMVIIVPGILYSMYYAFVPAALVHRNDEPVLKVSTVLTKPHRRRAFLLLALGVILGTAVALPAAIGADVLVAGSEDVGARIVGTAIFLTRQVPSSFSNLTVIGMAALLTAQAFGWMPAQAGLAQLYFDDDKQRGS